MPLAKDADAVALHLAGIALEAARLLRRLQGATTAGRIKPDGTPTTDADLAAEALIVARLREAWPDVPVVAEETASRARPDRRFFLVDPLDGTGDYLRGAGEYSVNIALIEEGRPIAAVVAAPALDRVWIAGASSRTSPIRPDGGFSWQPAASRRAPEDGLAALVSRRHGDPATEDCLSRLSIGSRRTASSALKFCLIASGEADVYVRCGPTMEWDTAAGDHILCRAGGCVVGPGGVQLTYGHDERAYRNGPFAAVGDVALVPQITLPNAVAA